MNIGIPKESGDNRVAVVPSSIKKLSELGVKVLVEKGAGESAMFTDEDYGEEVEILDRSSLFERAEVIISVLPLPYDELIEGKTYVSLFQPYNDKTVIEELKKHKVHAFSMDMIPRTTLAQSMDILSSMASIAGYKAVLEAAHHLPRYFPMMITAAGSIKPSKVLVLGAGVAGLQAIATARRLGAVVEAFDTRLAAKEEVESLGAKFVEVEGAKDDTSAGGYAVEQSEDFLKRQRAEVQARAIKSDIIITTAQVRGRKAPLLVPASTVEQMKKGSVIVDLASSTGGNCEVSQDNEVVDYKGVTVIGNSNLAGLMPQDASTLFSNNIVNFVKLIVKDEALHFNMDDEIVVSSLITKEEQE